MSRPGNYLFRPVRRERRRVARPCFARGVPFELESFLARRGRRRLVAFCFRGVTAFFTASPVAAMTASVEPIFSATVFKSVVSSLGFASALDFRSLTGPPLLPATKPLQSGSADVHGTAARLQA